MQSTIIWKTLTLFLAVTLLCSLFVGCTSAEIKLQPEDTILFLQDAINQFDVDLLLQCIDSAWASRLESLLAFSIGEDGFSLGSFFALVETAIPILPLVNFVFEGIITPDDLPKVTFTVLKTDIVDNTAAVALSGILVWGEYTKPFAATVDMTLENDVWVVCSIRL